MPKCTEYAICYYRMCKFPPQIGADLERASKSLLANHPEQTITLSAYLRFPAPSADVVV